MNTAFTLAWRNLWRHKRRTWLTVAAMLFSNFLLVFMMTLQFGTYDMMIDNSLRPISGHMEIARVGSLQDPKMRSVIKNAKELEAQLRNAFPLMNFLPRSKSFVLASSADRSMGIQILGVDPFQEGAFSSLPGAIIEGAYLQKGKSGGIIVGEVLARNLKLKVGDELTLLGSGYDGSFAATIVNVEGVFRSGITELDRSLGVVTLSEFNEVFSMHGAIHSIAVATSDISDVNTYRIEIQKYLKQENNNNEKNTLEVQTWEEVFPAIRQAITSDFSSSWFMYGVLILLVAFSVLNTQLMSVLERTREFGIMMAIGCGPGRLSALLMLETALMSLLGFILGCALGGVFAWYLSLSGFSYPGMEEMAAQYNMPDKIFPKLSIKTITLGPSIIFIASLLAALYPMLRLNKLQAIDAMKAP